MESNYGKSSISLYGDDDNTYNRDPGQDQKQRGNDNFLIENEQLRKTVNSLEITNRTLNENLLANQYEMRQMKAQIEELKTLYKDSITAKQEYDKYLDTVGQVYSVACESADNIVKRAEKSAHEILSVLEAKIKHARENAEKTMVMTRSIHDSFANSIPALIENIKLTFQEVDSFMSSVETVPNSFDNMFEAQNQAFSEIQTEIEEYRRNSRSLIEGAECSGIKSVSPAPEQPISQAVKPARTAILSPTPNMPSAALPNDYKPSVSTYRTYEKPPHDEPHSRMTLLEQEKMRRRQEELQTKQVTADTDSNHPATMDDKNQEQMSSPDITSIDVPATQPSESQDNTIIAAKQTNGRRRTNVKDLLDKYKNYQLI